LGAAHLGLRASDTMHFNSHNAPHAIVLKQRDIGSAISASSALQSIAGRSILRMDRKWPGEYRSRSPRRAM